MYLTKTKHRTYEILWLLGYILLVHTAGALRDFFIAPYLDRYVSHGYLIYNLLFDPLYKLLFWILPAFLYIRYVQQRNPFTYLKLNTHVRRGLTWAFFGTLFFCVQPTYALLVQGKGPHFNLGVDQWLNVVLLVGVMEEIPFRGIIFQKLQELMGFWYGSLISSLLFLTLHIPYRISIGEKLFPNMLYTMVYIFVFGFLMCITLRWSKSLWSCIILHSVNDLMSLVH